jgi:hypothetical protein
MEFYIAWMPNPDGRFGVSGWEEVPFHRHVQLTILCVSVLRMGTFIAWKLQALGKSGDSKQTIK